MVASCDGYLSGALFDCDCLKRRGIVSIDGLQKLMRSAENYDSIAGYVHLRNYIWLVNAKKYDVNGN